jgi:putative redox protein
MTEPTAEPTAQPAANPPVLGPETLRSVALTRIGEGRYKASNARGGETFIGSGGEDPDFTPVELLLAAIAGCSAIDIDAITGKRASATSFDVVTTGHKVRDELGNHMVGLRVSLDLVFPDDEAGDAARAALPRAMAQVRDRICTVSRTVALGEPIEYVDGSGTAQA